MDVDDIAFSCSLFSDKVDNRDGLNQLQMGYLLIYLPTQVQLTLTKIIKILLLPTDDGFYGENAPNSISAGAPPQTPLGELTALLQTP